MLRISVTDRNSLKLRELQPNEVISLVRHDEINGEHSLSITTTQELIVGQRIIYNDATGKWREYVIYGLEQEYRKGIKDIFTYYCVWCWCLWGVALLRD